MNTGYLPNEYYSLNLSLNWVIIVTQLSDYCHPVQWQWSPSWKTSYAKRKKH